MPGGGAQSAWLHELLSPYVAELVVAVASENKGPKDDLRDAWARADELRLAKLADAEEEAAPPQRGKVASLAQARRGARTVRGKR